MPVSSQQDIRVGGGLGYQIRSIDLLVRNISPPRMDFAIGQGQSLFPEWMRVNVEVRLRLESDGGRSAFGCSADWPSFGWLDKRSGVEPRQKLRELLELIGTARDSFLANKHFSTPFDAWWNARELFLETVVAKDAVPLCSSFAVALIERAVIDAVCRLEGLSFFSALSKNLLGLDLARIHPELKGQSLGGMLPKSPRGRIHIRHTIGLNDPLSADDVHGPGRLDDGEPQTLQDYIEQDGIKFFKVKICGDVESDLNRLARIWDIVGPRSPVITLDGNESYEDILAFDAFVKTLAGHQPEVFRRVKFIEQPMSRAKTHDQKMKPVVEAIASRKPLMVDEADGYLHAFSDATEIGYRGVSHKNCKGIFKSLANFALCRARSTERDVFFLSAEDLTCMPLVSLQQDLAVVSALGLSDAERNGHHFFRGLAHLSEAERRAAETHHPGLYKRRGNDLYLNIQDGQVDVSSLQCPGLGVVDAPDWDSMTSLESWLQVFES